MRLGTKILLLTLAIALGLAGAILWVVTSDITEHEQERARQSIDTAVRQYVTRTDLLHGTAKSIVDILMGDPANRSQLDQVGGMEESAANARAQLREEVFGRVVQEELTKSGQSPPAFHILLDSGGKMLLAGAPIIRRSGDPNPPMVVWDEGLQNALRGGNFAWPYKSIVEDRKTLRKQYLLIAGQLYLAMGFPLSIDLSDSAPITHVYFIGFKIDGPWTQRLLSPGTGSDASTKPSANHSQGSEQHEPALHAWFFIDGHATASASTAGSSHAPDALAAAAGDATWKVAGNAAGGAAMDRPVPIDFTASGERFLGQATTFPPAPGSRGALVVASSLTERLAALRHLQRTLAAVTAIAVVIAIIAFRFVSELIARPVRMLVAGTRRVAGGDFESPVNLRRRDELGELATSFNDMAAGLRQRDLIKNLLGKVIDPRVGEKYLADPALLKPGGERRVQSILFSDLQGFTAISERLDADVLVPLLNAYLEDAAETIAAEAGVLDKFIGDAVVAFWGPPFSDNHAARACRAGLRLVQAARRQESRCTALGIRPLTIRVGIATGPVVVGNMGSANRFDYTVIGDTANRGSRLEGLNKLYKTGVLVDARTAEEAGPAVIVRRIDTTRLYGRSEPVAVCEVLAEAGSEQADSAMKLRDRYEAALALYKASDWPTAMAAFKAAAGEFNDLVSDVMAARCAVLMEMGPPAGWDGVWNAESK